MVADDGGAGTGTEEPDSTDGRWTTWRLVRVALALCAILLGIVWTVRIAVTGAVTSDVLLRLLPPLALVYLGIYYYRSVVDSDADRS